MECLYNYNTGTLRKGKLPVLCSILPSDSGMIIKADSRNMMGRATP